jgi:carboxyl-terminal processing protease
MSTKPKNTMQAVRLPLFLGLTLVMGIFIGFKLNSNKTQNNPAGNYLRYMEVLNYINNDYVDTVNVDELVDYSIVQMLEKLDPHTVYIGKKDVELANSQLQGDFEGIGVEFNIIKDTIVVVAPISGGPSEQVGIQAGDRIVKVNGEVVAGTGVTTQDVFRYLRGKKGTKVTVTVVRRGSAKELDYIITRDKIPTYSVDAWYMLDAQTGYIKVSRFSQTTYTEFKKALTELKAQGMNRMVLDLKDNPGGYLNQAVEICDEFLSGNQLIVYTDGKESRYDSRYSASRTGLFESGSLMVLINEGSASASEIVSGALQDNDRAIIVGRRSFGKGLVQLPLPLQDGSELRLTISRYYTPSGRSIQKPYSADAPSDYEDDLSRRYEKGEYFHVDSIRFNDSLKFKTSKGRTVYGGGGIMPDYFVPRDTSAFTPYLIDLFNRNVIREYTLNYYTQNKNSLKNMSLEAYRKQFVVSAEMKQEIIKLAEKSGVVYKEKEFAKSWPYIETNVKAFIARGAYGNNGFFSIINDQDEVLQQALKLWPEADKIQAR